MLQTSFSPLPALSDEAVRMFARKVSLVTYQEYADVLEESPAKVTITLADGWKIERAKYYPTGSVQVPMTKAQIADKFIAWPPVAVFRPQLAEAGCVMA